MTPTVPTWASWFVWISDPYQPGFMMDLLGFETMFHGQEWIRVMLTKYVGENFDVDGGMDTGFRIYDRVLDQTRVVHNGHTLPAIIPGCPVLRQGDVPAPTLCAAPLHPTEIEQDAPVMDKRFPSLSAPDFRGRRLVMVIPSG